MHFSALIPNTFIYDTVLRNYFTNFEYSSTILSKRLAARYALELSRSLPSDKDNVDDIKSIISPVETTESFDFSRNGECSAMQFLLLFSSSDPSNALILMMKTLQSTIKQKYTQKKMGSNENLH